MLPRSFQDAFAVFTIEPSFPGPGASDGRVLPGREARAVLDRRLAGPTWGMAVTSLYHEILRGPLRPEDDAYLHRMREALLEAADRGRLVVVEHAMRGTGSVRREEIEEPASARPVRREPRKLVDLWVRLEIDPHDASSCGDKFVVSATDGSYRQTKTVKDDQVPGDTSIDLEFTDLFDDKSYNLQVIPAQGRPHFAFQNVPYSALEGYGQARAEPPYQPQPHDPTPEEVGA